MHGLAVSDVDIGREHASTSCSLSSSFFYINGSCLLDCIKFIIYLKSTFINIITSLIHEVVTIQ